MKEAGRAWTNSENMAIAQLLSETINAEVWVSAREVVMDRRALIIGFSLAPFLTTVVSAHSHNQVTQESIGYSGVPVNGEHCSLCKHFFPSKTCKKATCFGACDQVRGEINPNGWCKIFVEKAYTG
jgi:hypothetical protein